MSNKPYKCERCSSGILFLPEERASLEDTPKPLAACPNCGKDDQLRRMQVIHLVVPCGQDESAYYSEMNKTHYKFCCEDATKIVAQKKLPTSHTPIRKHCTCHGCLLATNEQPNDDFLE